MLTKFKPPDGVEQLLRTPSDPVLEVLAKVSSGVGVHA